MHTVAVSNATRARQPPCAHSFEPALLLRRAAKQLLNQHTLRKAEEVRKQLQRACARLGLPTPESCDGDMDHLRRGIVAVSACMHDVGVWGQEQGLPVREGVGAGKNRVPRHGGGDGSQHCGCRAHGTPLRPQSACMAHRCVVLVGRRSAL